jgi:hypothetical protein
MEFDAALFQQFPPAKHDILFQLETRNTVNQ